MYKLSFMTPLQRELGLQCRETCTHFSCFILLFILFSDIFPFLFAVDADSHGILWQKYCFHLLIIPNPFHFAISQHPLHKCFIGRDVPHAECTVWATLQVTPSHYLHPNEGLFLSSLYLRVFVFMFNVLSCTVIMMLIAAAVVWNLRFYNSCCAVSWCHVMK